MRPAAGRRHAALPRLPHPLVLGVQLTRAGFFVASGMAAGVLVAAVAAVSLNLTMPGDRAVAPATSLPVASSGAGTGPEASAAAAPTAPPEPAIPATARSALAVTAEMNARLAANAPTLRASLAEPGLDTFAVAQVLRSMTADAAFAAGAADRLAGWADAADVSAGLAVLYADVRATAREGLARTLASETAYRTPATRMLVVVAGLVPLDAASRELAAGAGIDLPAVDLQDPVPAEAPNPAPAEAPAR